MAQFQSHSSQFRCDGGDPIREALPRHGGHGCRPQSHEDTAASSVAFHRRDDHRSRTRPLYQFIHDLAKPGPQCETDHVEHVTHRERERHAKRLDGCCAVLHHRWCRLPPGLCPHFSSLAQTFGSLARARQSIGFRVKVGQGKQPGE
jgi:hypothetical protein